jgi:hypothetical protein
MKVTTGRGIKFFKKPVFNTPKNFVLNTYNFSKKQIANLMRKGKQK